MDKTPLKMSSRSARSMLKLSKPAPRKVSTNCSETIIQTKKTELTCAGDGLPVYKDSTTLLSMGNTTEKLEKNNIINKRASRGLRVEKPAPLKTTTAKRIEESANSALMTDNEQLQGQENLPMSCDAAKAMANSLIINALSDIEFKHSSCTVGVESKGKVRLMSQMSHDSGVEDLLSYSRQSSAFDSLSESIDYQDDLDWSNIDDEPAETFTLGRDKMQCTSFAVNQTLPFNSLIADTQSSSFSAIKHASAKLRGLKVNRKMTSTEEIKLPGVDESAELDMYDSANEKKRRHSEQGADKTVNINRQRPQSFDITYSALKRSQNTNSTKFGDLPKPVKNGHYEGNVSSSSEVREEDLIEVPRHEDGLEINNNKKISARNSESYPCLSDAEDTDVFNGCDEAFSDIETTPKAVDGLSKFANSKMSKEVLESELAPAFVCDENDNIKLCIDKETVTESLSEVMRRLSGNLEYREKDEIDLNSTCTKSSTDVEDGLSQSTQDEGFNEQEYIWELIEDLSNGVQCIKLEKNSDDSNNNILKKCLPPQFSLHEFSILPDNFAEIEAELEGLEEEMDKFDDVQTDVFKPVISSSKLQRVKNDFKSHVCIIRDPLSPYSSQEEIWRVEEGLPCGMYTAKGRRLMFKNFKLCQQEVKKKEPQSRIIQYAAIDLLELGTKPLSRQEPDAWSYLSVLFPEICLKKVSNYFDAAIYIMERCYVVENQNVENGKKHFSNNTRLYARQNSGSQGSKWQDRNATQIRTGGFGAPAKSISQAPNSSEDNHFGPRPRSSTPASDLWNPGNQSGSISDNKSNTSSNHVGLSFEANRESLNLDTKCDLHVGKNGMMPLSANSMQQYNNQTFIPNFNRSVSDPEGKMLSNALSGIGLTGRHRNSSSSSERSQTGFHGNRSDLVLKPDLPVKCPW